MKQFSDGRMTWRNFTFVAVGGVASFLVVQEVKVDHGILTSNDSFGQAYPVLLRPLLYLVRGSTTCRRSAMLTSQGSAGG